MKGEKHFGEDGPTQGRALAVTEKELFELAVADHIQQADAVARLQPILLLMRNRRA